METYTVKHVETAQVKAENKDKAIEKAINGETETWWETINHEVIDQ